MVISSISWKLFPPPEHPLSSSVLSLPKFYLPNKIPPNVKMLLPFAENIESFPWALGDFAPCPQTVCARVIVSDSSKSLDCRQPGSCVHEIFLARILKGVATLSFRGSSRPGDRTRVSCGSCIAGRFFTAEPPGKPPPKQLADLLCLGKMLASFAHFLWYSLTIIIFLKIFFDVSHF